ILLLASLEDEAAEDVVAAVCPQRADLAGADRQHHAAHSTVVIEPVDDETISRHAKPGRYAAVAAAVLDRCSRLVRAAARRCERPALVARGGRAARPTEERDAPRIGGARKRCRGERDERWTGVAEGICRRLVQPRLQVSGRRPGHDEGARV